MATPIIRSDFRQHIVRAMLTKLAWYQRNTLADASRIHADAENGWETYQSKNAALLGKVTLAETTKTSARAALADAEAAIEAAQSLPEAKRADALAKAQRAARDARRAISAANVAQAEAEAYVTSKGALHKSFDEYEMAMWQAVLTCEQQVTDYMETIARYRELAESEITKDDALRMWDYFKGLPVLQESTREREESKSGR